MGKIVKYCAACDESFAEKFAFCPGCGQAMTAFEMNPLNGETKISEAPTAVEIAETIQTSEPESRADVPIAPPVSLESAPGEEIPATAADRKFYTVQPIKTAAVDDSVINEPAVEDSIAEEASVQENVPENDFEPETKTFAAAGNSGSNGNVYQTLPNDAQAGFGNSANAPKGGYNITVIEEKNVGRRNGLLLGTMVLISTIVLGATVYSLFSKDFLVGAIDQGNPLYVTAIDDVPPPIDEQPPPVKSKKDGGGGGGGGKDEPEEASKGRLVSQSDKPINPPDAKLPQLTNPDIKIIQETQGKIKRPITEERAGLPGSDNLNPSNGNGRGGGIGSGQGTGMGGGLGTGEGNGIGSGSGNGRGTGIGNNSGGGTENDPKPPPPPSVPVGPTEGVKIISKPKPPYTDSARQNQVTGVVRLRVTFTANGQIGSVAPVSGLPYGLTEQAIAAAKQIRFEPAKKNGQPIASTRVIEYSFSIF